MSEYSNVLEKILDRKTKGKNNEILYSHWVFDKKQVPIVLNKIIEYFPHYSLHDESHSKNIIEIIVKIFGKNCRLFTPLDIWLFLEAAYWHDYGMSLSKDEVDSIIKTEEFKQYFKQLKSDINYDLYTIYFFEKDDVLYIKETIWNTDIEYSIKYLIAEFTRKNHAEKSNKDIINSNSFAYNVLPERLFRLLGNICLCHGEDFNDIFNLPISDYITGIGTCHPRFIACLLRIGDLLDLENNRFPRILFKRINKIPSLSVSHYNKHRSIKYLKIDSERIDITADTRNIESNDENSKYEAYDVIQFWFNLIKDELTNQIMKWDSIKPKNKNFKIPLPGEFIIEHDNFVPLGEKGNVSFELDKENIQLLIEGNNIYKSKFSCIDELLQNAVDASLIKIWDDEIKNNVEDFSKIEGIREKYLKNKKIEVDIKLVKEKSIGENNVWEIMIIDKGIGFSKEDLNYFRKIGASRKNIKKINIINEMPEWLKPSGYFGIGFQSLQILTKNAEIRTTSYFTGEKFDIIISWEDNFSGSRILVKGNKETKLSDSGTCLTFYYKEKKIPDRYYYFNEEDDNSDLYMQIKNFDPVTDSSFNINIYHLIKQIKKFAFNSPINIEVKYNDKTITTNINNLKFSFFNKIYNIEFNCIPSFYGDTYIHWIYYRGRVVERVNYLCFFGLTINLMCSNAGKYLEINREKIRNDIKHELHDTLVKCVYCEIISDYQKFKDIIKDYINSFIGGEKDKKWIIDNIDISTSLFLNYYNIFSENLIKEIPNDLKDKYLDAKIGNENYTINDVLESNKIEINIIKKTNFDYLNRDKEFNGIISIKKDNNNDFNICFSNEFYSYEFNKFLLYKINEKFIYVNFNEYKKGNGIETEKYIFSKEDMNREICEDLTYKEILERSLINKKYKRSLIVCLKKYEDLTFKKDWKNYINSDNFLFNHLDDKKFMMSPFVYNDSTKKIEIPNFEALIDYVYKNRANELLEKESIRNKYKEFIKYVLNNLFTDDERFSDIRKEYL